MKQILIALCCIITFVTWGSIQRLNAQRVKYNFNPGWKLLVGDPADAYKPDYNDASWKNITLPRAWNEDDAFKKDIVDLSTGISWYRKHFKLPAASKGQKVFVEFEGIRQAVDFYVNGKHVGIHENGVTAFGFDITGLVNFGGVDNVIAARIDNDWNYKEKATDTKYQWEDKNFNANYGGICKNVFLHITPKIYQTLPLLTHLGTTGVYVHADNFNIKGKSATIHAESEVKNETGKSEQVEYEVSVKDMNGKTVKVFTGGKLTLAPGETKTLKAAARVSDLNFWSWGYGYLYDVQTTLKVNGKPIDVVTTKTGFRKTEFKNGMIYLNDRVIMVHGYAQRTSNEWPAIGMSVPAWLSDYSNRLMVESGGNLVRWMHIAPWKQDVESCDRVGLMQAMPAGDAEKDVTGTRWEQRKAVMRDAIVYNRNNPSIIFYECGNESISEAHMQEMKAVRDQYDPHGGRAIGSREMLDSKVAEYGGEMLYTNKSAHIPMWAMEYSRDEGLRKYWDDFTPPYHKDGDGPDTYKSAATNTIQKRPDAKVYNRNMESHAVENVKRWYEFWRERPGTGKRVSSGGVNIVFSETNTHYRGAENYRRSGEVDALRIKKQNFYAHQVMWDGWVNPEKYRIHIVGHWNYAPGVQKDIYVISSADKVELKVNGQSLGYGVKSDGFLYTFKNVAWKAGNISAVGYDQAGKEMCTAQINTVGTPTAIRLTNIKSPRGLIADGHDLALVEVEVVDAKGNRCPTALNMINFSLEGPAEWRGGMAQGPDNYILAKSLPVENGVNRVLIRSTNKPGVVTIKATADGLKSASISLTAQPFAAENGLAKLLPSAALPSNLERGPTPSMPSYQMTRKPLTIVNATSGANSDSAFASYDDNELSDWVNDGELSTAWIEYELEREATVNEVTLKLNNFRSRVYPLLITVDGNEAFNGSTATTLGYYTVVCKPQRGKKVRIQLATLTKDQEGNKMVEVTGKKLDDGVARDDAKAKGTLSIIEAEIYESLPVQHLSAASKNR
jgi:beta-galactosidase